MAESGAVETQLWYGGDVPLDFEWLAARNWGWSHSQRAVGWPASSLQTSGDGTHLIRTLIQEVKRLSEENQELRHTPRLWHDWNDGPPDHCWLLKGEQVVIADGDPTGPVESGWKIKKAVRVEVER